MNAARFTKQRRDIEHRFREKPGRINKAMSSLISDAGATCIVIEKRVIGWRMKTGEIVCVKSRFSSQALAARCVVNIAETSTGHIPTRVYQCDHCQGWHVTSQQFRVV